MNSLLAQCGGILDALRAEKPLVHHITNYVTVNDCANMTLAIGASPIMADAMEEAADIARLSSALVLNIGTLNSRTAASMLAAGKAANEKGIPVVFDPVGAGASAFRNDAAAQILREVRVSVVRGNISEVRFLAGLSSNTKGVDASADDEADNAADVAQIVARALHCVVAITGAIDTIADAARVIHIRNGHPMMADVTGTGCMCTSLVGSFCGASPQHFEATAAAVMCMGIAGELAFEAVGQKGTGSYRAALADAVSRMDKNTMEERGCINGCK